MSRSARAAFVVSACTLVGCGASDGALPTSETSPTDSTIATVSLIDWSSPSDCPDGLAVSADSVVVFGCEVVSSFDRSTGALRWSSPMSDTSGFTPSSITPTGVIVIAPEFEPVQAFDLDSGTEVFPPDAAEPPDLPPTQLPEGYRFDNGDLTYNGTVVWTSSTSEVPFVGRLGTATIINDFDLGLSIVDDQGTILDSPPLGRRDYDTSPVVIDHDQAFVVTADGVLYAIESRT